MPELFKPLLPLLIATATSLAGTVCIRLASDQTLLWLAILGGSLWSLSGAAFVLAATFDGVELGVYSALMSAGGIILINLIGIAFWGEAINPRKIIALTFLTISICLLAWPTTRP
ncbi:SMR family transporter [Shimia sp. MMG029]|uniref:SMR family transporter n=1 Tax=Shimia sp. MMG029 TaxID=3021978 RepID=UPI0022FDB9D7|nr:SMR family transporter [Shimia sp. MMG029]MDA5556050.1 SMR family transporter [Shimia sp. MMG029]